MTTLVLREIVTPDNFSPIVSIVTWILLATMVLSICLRLTLNMFIAQAFKGDDKMLLLALFLGIGQSVAVEVQAANGIGRHRESLVASQIAVYQKAGYASSLFYIAGLAISKILVLFLLRQITPVLLHRRLILAVGVFTATWTVANLFASAFQCSTPNPWMILGTRCFNQISFWVSYATFNIITEIALIVLPTYALWGVHIKRGRKLIIVACFASRVTVIGAIIAQLVQLKQLQTTTDATFDYWRYSLCTQIVQCLSVVTASASSIKNFLTSLESGMIQTGQFQLRKTSASPSPNNTSLPSSALNRPPAAPTTGAKRCNGTLNPSQLSELNEHSLVSRNIAVVEFGDEVAHSDAVSESSQAGIIKKTTGWSVDYNTQESAVQVPLGTSSSLGA